MPRAAIVTCFAALSAMLIVVTAWVRGESDGDAVVIRRLGTARGAPDPQAESVWAFGVVFTRGDLRVAYYAGWQSPRSRLPPLPVSGWATAVDEADDGRYFESATRQWWRFGWAVRADQSSTARRFGWQLTTPIAVWVAASAATAVVAGRRAIRPWRWRRRGRCGRCGYDLRGIVGRCPECGAAVRAAVPLP